MEDIVLKEYKGYVVSNPQKTKYIGRAIENPHGGWFCDAIVATDNWNKIKTYRTKKEAIADIKIYNEGELFKSDEKVRKINWEIHKFSGKMIMHIDNME